MPTFEFKAEYVATDLIHIDAETEEEAREKFNEGNWDDSAETNVDYQLQELLSVKEV